MSVVQIVELLFLWHGYRTDWSRERVLSRTTRSSRASRAHQLNFTRFRHEERVWAGDKRTAITCWTSVTFRASARVGTNP